MSKHEASFDFLLSTIPTAHDVNLSVPLLKRDATQTLVGPLAPLEPGINPMQVASQCRSVAGPLIGSLAETQEILDFCAAHRIVADVEIIPIYDINTAFERMNKGDVKYRFVIDMASLK